MLRPLLLTALTLAWSAPAAALELSGTITEVLATPPAPFAEVQVGDPWTLELAMDEGAFDVDGSASAGQYREAVLRVQLSIGDAELSGAPGAAIPGGYGSVVSVNLGEGYADYSAQVGTPDAAAWAQVALWDEAGTPLDSDALPLAIDPADFPDAQRFYLRMPGSSALYLQGELGEPEPAPEELTVPSELAPTIQAAVDLVADGGTIELEGGVFEETVIISGKQVHIVGAGTHEDGTLWLGEIPESPEDCEDGTALITYGAGGGGSLTDIAFMGGDIAIAGVEEDGERPAELEVKDVSISETGNAVAGTFSAFAMEDFEVLDTQKSGLKLDAPYALRLLNGFIDNSKAAGIVVHNYVNLGVGTVHIEDVYVVFHSEGGIIVAGDFQSVIIQDCGIGWVGKAGIMLLDVGTALVWDCSIASVHRDHGSVFRDLAYGIVLWETDFAWIQDTDITLAEEAGIVTGGSGGLIRGTSTSGGRFGGLFMSSPDLDWDHDSNSYSGFDNDYLFDANLPLPELPPIPE